MLFYAFRRLMVAIPTFITVLLITFSLTAISPFDPVAMMMVQYEGTLDTLAEEEMIERIRDQYGLNDAFSVQFIRWISRLAQGDLGISINGQRDVLRNGKKRPRITLVNPPRLLPIVAVKTKTQG